MSFPLDPCNLAPAVRMVATRVLLTATSLSLLTSSAVGVKQLAVAQIQLRRRARCMKATGVALIASSPGAGGLGPLRVLRATPSVYGKNLAVTSRHSCIGWPMPGALGGTDATPGDRLRPTAFDGHPGKAMTRAGPVQAGAGWLICDAGKAMIEASPPPAAARCGRSSATAGSVLYSVA